MSLGTLEHEWRPYDPCPCPDDRCEMRAPKLSVKTGHAIGCVCRPCIGRRSQRKGKANQAKTHRRLGGTGFTPSNEESARPYVLEVAVMPEDKTGDQVPASWDNFIATEWFGRALDQAARAVPAGSGVLPALAIRSQFVVVDIRPRRTP